MSSLTNNMFLVANRANLNIGYVKLGLVQSSNPNNSQITVALQPEGTLTGWMPYLTPWIGWFSPPKSGDQVMVFFQEGSNDVPLGGLALYWVQAQPPAGMNIGEAIWQHSSGAGIKLSNDGSVTITGKPDVVVNTDGNLTATIGGDASITASSGTISLTSPTINLTGDVVISGDLSANGGALTMSAGTMVTSGSITATGNVTGNGISLDSHIHGGVTTGGGNTGAPV